MDKKNHFSDKFESKTTEELRNIIDNKDYQKEAQLAAAWELERRSELGQDQQDFAQSLVAKNIQQAEQRTIARRYETFGPRFIAAILDGLVLMAAGLLLNLINNNLHGLIYIILLGMLHQFLPFIYSILMHGTYGQTLGKMAMKVKVVDFKSEENITMFQAFLRDCIPLLLMLVSYFMIAIITNGFKNEWITPEPGFNLASTVITIINGLSLVWSILEIGSMLMNEKSRAIHDLIAKTVVVRTE